jgi:hypothetical protein
MSSPNTWWTIAWAFTAVVLCIASSATPVGGWGGITSIILLVALIAWRSQSSGGTKPGKKQQSGAEGILRQVGKGVSQLEQAMGVADPQPQQPAEPPAEPPANPNAGGPPVPPPLPAAKP